MQSGSINPLHEDGITPLITTATQAALDQPRATLFFLPSLVATICCHLPARPGQPRCQTDRAQHRTARLAHNCLRLGVAGGRQQKWIQPWRHGKHSKPRPGEALALATHSAATTTDPHHVENSDLFSRHPNALHRTVRRPREISAPDDRKGSIPPRET